MRPAQRANAFPKALRHARKARGLTQEDFTDVSGRTYVSSLERGLKSPTLDKIDMFAQALGLHPLTLLTLAYTSPNRPESVERLQKRVIAELQDLERKAS